MRKKHLQEYYQR
jgi:hypothetical protein